jgi:hypothetical protein
MYQVRNDVVLNVGASPRPDPGAPLPAVVSDERHLLLAYIVEAPDPSWNGTYVSVVSSDSPDEAIAIVAFQNQVCHLFGPPNDEAFAGHPLAARGLRPYTVNEVAKSSWIQDLERMNAVHPRHRSGYLNSCHHYIFAFHDSTFECVAEGFTVQMHRGSLRSAVRLMVARLGVEA